MTRSVRRPPAPKLVAQLDTFGTPTVHLATSLPGRKDWELGEDSAADPLLRDHHHGAVESIAEQGKRTQSPVGFRGCVERGHPQEDDPGGTPYHRVRLKAECRLRDLLRHLYVRIQSLSQAGHSHRVERFQLGADALLPSPRRTWEVDQETR